jgi:hypothetical protein
MWDNSGFVSYKGFVARARFGEWIYKKERKKVFDQGYFSEKAVQEKEEKQEENSTWIERKCSGTKSPNGTKLNGNRNLDRKTKCITNRKLLMVFEFPNKP